MKKLLLLITLVAGVIAFALSAQATTLTFGLDCEFSGATAPVGDAPWITAIFDDSFGGDNTVRLTMSASNLMGTEFIDDWFFNFDDNLNVENLSFIPVDTSDSTPNNINTGKQPVPPLGLNCTSCLGPMIEGCICSNNQLFLFLSRPGRFF